MSSPRLKQFYLDLLETCRGIKENNKPVFKYYNIWNDQLEDAISGDGYVFANPAIFFEIELGECKIIGAGVQTYPECVVRVHICSMVLDGQENTMERNVKTFDLAALIVKTWNGKSPSHTSSFQLKENKQDFSHSNYYEHIIGFSTNFIDTTGTIFENPDKGYIKEFKINFVDIYVDEDGVAYGEDLITYIKS